MRTPNLEPNVQMGIQKQHQPMHMPFSSNIDPINFGSNPCQPISNDEDNEMTVTDQVAFD